jgi:sulfur carrier protein
MNVVVNGEAVELPAGATVADAVRASGAPGAGEGVAAALEGEVVRRAEWASTELSSGAHVEVLQAVQGG